MIKVAHSVFALPFALIAVFLAARHRAQSPRPTIAELGLIVLCMVAARSFAMTINRIADARFDALNPRTANRAIPAGLIRRRAAWLFALICAVIFLIACAGFRRVSGNYWPLLLGPLVLAYLAGYSFTKRFTSLAHFALGLAIASAPAAAWIAIDPASLGVAAVLLVLAAATWIAGFDIIYACQDADFDRSAGLHSLPARMGIGRALWVSRISHVATAACLLLLPAFEPMGTPYWIGAAATVALLGYEQRLVRANDLSRVNVAFFTVNGVIGLIFGTLAIADVFLR